MKLSLSWLLGLVLAVSGCVTETTDRHSQESYVTSKQPESKQSESKQPESKQQEDNTADCYIIDSKPQGLRVVVDDFERGFTPCVLKRKDYSYSHSIHIEVKPPTDQQIYDYCIANRKVVSIMITGPQSKWINTDIPGGRLLFEFIEKEYNAPTTEEEKEWVLEKMEEDSAELKRKREALRN